MQLHRNLNAIERQRSVKAYYKFKSNNSLLRGLPSKMMHLPKSLFTKRTKTLTESAIYLLSALAVNGNALCMAARGEKY